VCLHGAGFTGYVFDAQRAVFGDLRAPNLPGHETPGEPATVEEFAQYVERYAQAQGLDRIVLCGHSLGGAVALQIALRKLISVEALVLLGSGARLRVAPAILEGLKEDFEATASRIAGALYADANSPLVTQARRSFLKTGQAQLLRDFTACNSFDLTAALSSIGIPLLAVTGEQDVMTPPKYAQALAAGVVHGSSLIIPNAGHMVMQERPVETNVALRNFVTALS
jgi:pimeloyl-ACP methyl ester carboxylesterase